MPAPPNFSGTVMPRTPRSPSLRKSSTLKDSERSCASAWGSTSRSVKSRIVRRSAACSSVGLKRSVTVSSCFVLRQAQHERKGSIGDSRPHQVHEVVAIEPLLRRLRNPAHRVLESPEGISAAFDVRAVGREETHLFARLLDDPSDGLGGIGGRADLTAHILARAEFELAQ